LDWNGYTASTYVLLSVAKMDELCECLFLGNSVLHGTVIEENQRDYCVHDICSRGGQGVFNKIFPRL
jgi:hypothetical protein